MFTCSCPNLCSSLVSNIGNATGPLLHLCPPKGSTVLSHDMPDLSWGTPSRPAKSSGTIRSQHGTHGKDEEKFLSGSFQAFCSRALLIWNFKRGGCGYMGVCKNSDTPKSSILIGFSIINHPFWGTPIFGNTHISIYRIGTHNYHVRKIKCCKGALTAILKDSRFLVYSLYQNGRRPCW